ncbi:DMT family transporter [Zooshikella ganghwensis]|uniref:DMT family transporter n=2 Tax=Zooshikella ganghwensis TaxID=202772 RepID=A0A4P9VQM6_9GAMM|nr:DMT family transporter [Zooshikella ganghwensis]RDH44877.1 DMT family transporter [Zooshikella ganghwensis]
MRNWSAKPNLLASMLLVCAMFLWGSSFIALKIAFTAYPPLLVIFIRMLIASSCFVFIWKYANRFKYQAGDWKYLALMGLFEPCLYFLCETYALQNTTASAAGMITALLPLLVVIAAAIFLKEKINKQVGIGLALALIGACWLSLSGKSSADAPNPLLGNFFEFLAMICATGYTLVVKKLSSRYSALFLTAIQAFIGTLFFSPALFLTDLPTEFPYTPTIAIVYLGIVVTLGAYGLYNISLSYISATQASVFVNLIPVFTILLAFIILGEKLTHQQLMAVLLVFLGLLVSQIAPSATIEEAEASPS